jgi:hypothetical protein
LSTLVNNAAKTKEAIQQAGARIDKAEKSMDTTLADVSARAKANATETTGITLADLQQQAGKLRKVNAAANKLATHKAEADLAETLRNALAKKFQGARGTASDSDDADADAFKQQQQQWHTAALYFAVLLQSLDGEGM